MARAGRWAWPMRFSVTRAWRTRRQGSRRLGVFVVRAYWRTLPDGTLSYCVVQQQPRYQVVLGLLLAFVGRKKSEDTVLERCTLSHLDSSLVVAASDPPSAPSSNAMFEHFFDPRSNGKPEC